MEEDADFWHRSELQDELAEDNRRSLASLVKENSKTPSRTQRSAAISVGKTHLAVCSRLNEIRCGKAILGFG